MHVHNDLHLFAVSLLPTHPPVILMHRDGAVVVGVVQNSVSPSPSNEGALLTVDKGVVED